MPRKSSSIRPDEPNTFAKICAALDTLDLSVHDARIYSDDRRQHARYFLRAARVTAALWIHHPDTFREIRQTIQHNLLQSTAKTVTRHMPRTVKSLHDSDANSLLHGSVERPHDAGNQYRGPTRDLLARIGSVLSRHGVTVQGAKIQTLGERVEDIFFLSDDNGRSLEDQSLIARLEGRADRRDDVGTAARSGGGDRCLNTGLKALQPYPFERLNALLQGSPLLISRLFP
jgi:[protein-PII] uridylyltransferase